MIKKKKIKNDIDYGEYRKMITVLYAVDVKCNLVPRTIAYMTADHLGACFFFSSRRRHTRYWRDWSSDVCSSDLCTTARKKFSRGLGQMHAEHADFWWVTGHGRSV